VAREGGVTAAAEKLHVSQPAISAQVRKLERALGHQLFDRSGRSLVLTPEGRIVLEYADDIFRLGRELSDTLKGRLEGRPLRLIVGLTDSIPKIVAFHLLQPAFEIPDPVRFVVREDRPDQLLAQLATHDLDLVLSDMPIPPHINVQAYNHLLGESAIAIFGRADLAAPLRDDFPTSLDGAPFLLHADGYPLRRSLDDWFAAHRIQPLPVAEFADSALIRVFAEAGKGLFAAPTVIADEICAKFGVLLIGTATGIRERYYAITGERRIKHPAVAAISEAARATLFTAE
jgi:LysR family transcriptional regulator, transcriptional activator of nhaA